MISYYCILYHEANIVLLYVLIDIHDLFRVLNILSLRCEFCISVIYIRKQHLRIFIRMRYSEILYKIQVKFTIAYPDENPEMLFSNVNH
jgi:hypothetical protein